MLLPSHSTYGVQNGQRQFDVPDVRLDCFQIAARGYPVLAECMSPTLHFSIEVRENVQLVHLSLQKGYVDHP